MTDSSLRPGAMISLDEHRPVPGVVLRGASPRLRQPGLSPSSAAIVGSDQGVVGGDRRGGSSAETPPEFGPAPAPVDGMAVLFFDPQTGHPHLVFASEGLAAMADCSIDELLGRDPADLFHQGGRECLAEIRRGLGLDQQRVVDQEMVERIRPLLAAKPLPRRRSDRRSGPAIDLDALDLDSFDGDGVPTLDLPLDDLPIGTQSSDQPSFDLPPGLDVDLIDRLAPLGRLVDLAGTGDAPPRLLSAPQQLARRSGRPLAVHASYSAIPSMTPSAPYVVAEFRDLEQPSAERLLADQAAVVRSLGRGYELGRVCHQVATEVERELGDGSRCWVAVRSADGVMEPVLAGGLPFEMVQGTVAELLRLGHPLSRRVVAVDALTDMRTRHLKNCSVATLWYLPLAAELEPPNGLDDGDESVALRGVMVVATPRPRPTRAEARSLEHLAAVLHTAVEQATVEAELAHQTLHDPLTGLPNRALLVDRLGQVMARLERDDVALSVLLVDIDRFRTVNDSRGAEVGDRVLREVAGRLLTAVRLGDTVGRLSSDQYLVMCAARKEELDAKAVARRILRSLAEPISIGEGDELHITASVGVVVVDEPGSSPAAVISSAESALARATAAGRGRMAMFEADHRHHQVEQHVIEQALHRAIGTDELVIHYQPLVEIRTGYMVGAEALVRWDRPGHGMVSPGEFIPIAEESELIIPLGKWIIDQVCRDLGRWPRSHGRTPMVTINLGARQLGADTLVPTVISALRRNRLQPRQLGFEITESMEIRDAEAAVVNLNRLKELGSRIAIDDFGIGHATLEYIRRFSMADALKIDRSFVAGLGNSREDTAIVDASIALASSLGLQIIAEGVEELDQLHGLRDRGARYAQGYALARPMPLDQVMALWRRQRLYDPPWVDPASEHEPHRGSGQVASGQLPNGIGTHGG